MNPIWPTWLKVSYVVVCVVATAMIMALWGGFITPYATLVGDWLTTSFGSIGAIAMIVLAAVPLAIYAYRN